jgi:putative flippase GtrA
MASPALLDRPIIRQGLRFAVVGVVNTFTCLAIVWTLRDAAGLPVWLASAAGYVVATVQSYLVNRAWTFGGGGEAAVPMGAQMLRFVLLNVVTGLLFTALTSMLEPALGVRAASVIALVPVTLISFIGARMFVFHKSGAP